jgi:hypothetical protein
MNGYIARRVLHCQLAGKTQEVIVSFGIPRQETDYFTCEYTISVAGESEAYQIIGSDSVHYSLRCSWSALLCNPLREPASGVGMMSLIQGFRLASISQF